MTQRRLRQANLMGPGGLVSMDDGEVIARAQEGFRNAADAAGVIEMGGRDYADATTWSPTWRCAPFTAATAT